MFSQNSFYIFIVYVALFSCTNKTPENTSVPRIADTTVYIEPQEVLTATDEGPFRDLRDFPAIADENNVDTLISNMIAGDCVYGPGVGFAGAYTKEYAYFERLTQLLSDKEMFALIRHPNAIIRLYALTALDNENSAYLDEAKKVLKTDQAEVCTFSGCSVMTQKLKDVYAVYQTEEN